MIESSLSNRKKCVKNSIKFSNWVTISHKEPQRNVCGPLIFIMYINFFPDKLKKRTFYGSQLTHALFLIPDPMKIFYANLTAYLKILTVI